MIGLARTLGRRWRRVVIVVGLLAIGFVSLPVVQMEVPYARALFDREGVLLSAHVSEDGQWRFPPSGEVPLRFKLAITTFEDERFDWHPGVDVLAIGRAIKQNLMAGKVVSGASTLTMQVVRMSRGRDRTFVEKAIEAALALRLELARSKEEVLQMYAAHAPFGGNVVGLEAATWRWFGRAPGDLTWSEAATLAVLPNSPALIHPGRNRDKLRDKRDRLLTRLAAAGFMTDEELTLAKLEPLPIKPRPFPQLAPHLLQRAIQESAAARVSSTLDGSLQARVEGLARRHRGRIAGAGIHNVAVVVLDVESGAALAYVGNVMSGGEHEGYVDVARAPRSTGSTLKPFSYEAALDTGVHLPQEILSDVPLRIGGFAPQNFDGKYAGAVAADRALSQSLNVPAAVLLKRLGVPVLHQRLKDAGMTTLSKSPDHYGLALVLGGAEGRLDELTAAYADLARAAQTANAPHRAMRYAGESRATTKGPFSRASSWLTLEALTEVKRPGVDGAWRNLGGRKVAWKTGTSHGFRDAWALAVTPKHAVGVWVGNADGEGRAGLTGHRAAAPLLFEVLDLLPKGAWFDQPPELRSELVCEHSGMRAGPACEQTRPALLPPRARTAATCVYCQRAHVHRETGERAHAGCADLDDLEERAYFVLPPEMAAFAQRSRGRAFGRMPSLMAGCGFDASARIALISPKAASQVFIPIELDGSLGQLSLTATHEDPTARIYWHLDDGYLGETTAIHQQEVRPTPGMHTITLVDDSGARLERKFTVLGRP